MSTPETDDHTQHDLLDKIVAALGRDVIGQFLAYARNDWRAGRPGPYAQSEGIEPPVALSADPDGVSFRRGNEIGCLPLEALLAFESKSTDV
jgi:hypothetical protein